MEIGSRVGPYEIRQPLGEGGMAQVWKAWHLSLHRFEALKLPKPYLAEGQGMGREPGDERAFIARFLHEARIAAGLRHPHIATIYGVSEADAPQPFFAMELVEGGDLAVLLRAHGRMSLQQALPILEAIAQALDYAHGHGVIHRDIKPANVLLEATPHGWSPKVVDFGIAHARHAQAEHAPSEQEVLLRPDAEGSIVGTPEYMSPEQAGSGEEVGPRSDIYSLGVVAFEMLCGRPPFAALGDFGPISILAQHLSDLPPRPSDWHPELPAALDEALGRALAKSPQQRPASGEEFVRALRAAQEPGLSAPEPASTWGPHDALLAAATASAAGSEPAASTYTGPASPTLVQASASPVAQASGAKPLARKKPAAHWLAPVSVAAALCLAAALLGARLSHTGPAASPASTSGAASAPAAAEETAPASLPTALPSELPTALPAELPTALPEKTGARAGDAERLARAESTAQRARRVKLNVIESLLLLRKRQQQNLLRPSEAAASRRKLAARLRQALLLCAQALKLDPDNETAWEQKAALLFLMGRFEEALAVARQGLQKFPDNRDLQDARDKAGARLNSLNLSPQGQA